MTDKCPHGEFLGLCHACSEALIYALKHKLELAEKVIEAAREISCGNHVNCKEHGYAALYTAIKEFDVANG